HVGRSFELAEVEDVDDVRVAHVRDRLCFAPETCDRVRVRRQPLEDLDGSGALELRMVGAVDHAHGPLAYEFLDDVRTQHGPWADRHGTDYGVGFTPSKPRDPS